MMFNIHEIKLLSEQLTGCISKLRQQVDQTDVNAAEHVSLENHMIVLVGIKRKLAINLQQQQAAEAQKTKQIKVLVVDDSQAVREVVRCYLDELGFKQVDIASDGLEAWRMMQRNLEKGCPYGLVVSDWNMPKMCGIDLLNAIRKDSELFGTPVYLVTAVRDKEKILSAIKQGINGYMVKPVNFNNIKEKFSQYLTP